MGTEPTSLDRDDAELQRINVSVAEHRVRVQ